MKYRKKPVVIEAIQMPTTDEPTEAEIDAVTGFLGDADWFSDYDGGISLPTLEGTMRADPGDWIIRGIKGEIYPCKPDIFDATYELVTS